MTLRNISEPGESACIAAPVIEKAMRRAGETVSGAIRQILGDRCRDVAVGSACTETRRLAAAGNDLGLKRRASVAGLRQPRVTERGRNRALSARLAGKL